MFILQTTAQLKISGGEIGVSLVDNSCTTNMSWGHPNNWIRYTCMQVYESSQYRICTHKI